MPNGFRSLAELGFEACITNLIEFEQPLYIVSGRTYRWLKEHGYFDQPKENRHETVDE